MPVEAWITVGVVGAVFALLVTDRFPSEGVLMGALVALMVFGILDPGDAFAGFSNPAVIALGGLYVLTGALRETGALDRPTQRLLSGVRTAASARRRLTLVTTPLSGFLNNTPIVAMLMPIASAWARHTRNSPRELLLPLSYAAVLGGTCTLFGTATHLVVDGALIERGLPGLGVFELTPIGLPVALVGLPLTWWLAARLLRAADDAVSHGDDAESRREYTTDLIVTRESPLAGATVEDAGLRHLAGLFLVRVERHDAVFAPVGPELVLEAGDRLTFAGILDTIVELQRRRGLAPAEQGSASDWVLTEAVISRGSPLVGVGIREANFRGRYNAAVVAVHRHGGRIDKKLGDIVLRHGDTLLLQADPGFARSWRDARDFYLISELPEATRPRHARAPVALACMVGVIGVAAAGVMPLAAAAVTGAMVAVLAGCLSFGAARRAIDITVLVVVAAALGLGRAVEQTGVAGVIAEQVGSLAGTLSPVLLLALIYLAGMILTELITNTAAAALLLPIALAVATDAGLDPRPFVLATSIAASLSLATPLGYQTNMMVYGPGGYRFTDFLRMGLPVQLVCGVVAVGMLTMLYGL